eukprot:CAMPEP_0201514370 /NCGR_PEP_ID=MMETSP0161_2-20130828/6227_1 /ASSEMBLY_ACC=CAM_ASM_000251 /TAXON_ID=180227 /ORGANISM="Neoparamoeba aestuarina, Strain SoJaBio B1-5/56/2" /LENGTH=153 /DNA_ID=CAMNT_0047910899 /DNA_START=74 /DNA_END=535 /DNA_ORIENTATION=+
MDILVLIGYFIIGILAGFTFAKIKDIDNDNNNNNNNKKKKKGKVPSDPAKLVLAVRMDVKMSTEDVCVLSAQATLNSFNVANEENPAAVRHWLKNCQTKIAVKVPDEETLLQLESNCKKDGIPCYLDPDHRILGVGPASIAKINEVTGHLKLL